MTYYPAGFYGVKEIAQKIELIVEFNKGMKRARLMGQEKYLTEEEFNKILENVRNGVGRLIANKY